MGTSSSLKAAGVILFIVVAYFGFSAVFRQNVTENENTEEAGQPDFAVLATKLSPQAWKQEIRIRGRTEAIRKVTVRSETAGVVAQTPTRIGATVETGDVLCRLKVDARQSQLNQAKAALSKAKIDYDAASELKKEGLGSDNSVATAKAALDLARATTLQAELSLDQTKITAPFEGVFDERMAEAGDFLSVGDPCGIVIQRSPFLVIGAVSEREVGKISSGDRGLATLATGETIEGTIRFVATAADPATRTFDVELEIPNENGSLRDGVTAEFTVFASERNAHLVKRAALIIDDKGVVGVKQVDANNKVIFTPVRLLGESLDGVYVGGLNGEVSIITRGQEYVTDGETVAITYTSDGSEKELTTGALPGGAPRGERS